MSGPIIAPSLLAANALNYQQEIARVKKAGVNWMHYDVMDYHYVPNLTFGAGILADLKSGFPSLFWDVHLMTYNVDELAVDFIKAGADLISFHPEASPHLDRTIELIKSSGVRVGLAFNPASPLIYLEHTIHKLDLVLIMSVNPGFGNQKFINESIQKIEQAAKIIEQAKSKHNLKNDIWLQVDGGINSATAKLVRAAKANVLVAGSAIFKAENYELAINSLVD